jgi:plastocyanin
MKKRIAALLGATGVLGALSAPSLGRHEAAQAHAARTITIRMGEYFYRPAAATIHAGDRIRFVNGGKIEHTVADSTRSGAVRSRVIKPRPLKHGQSQTVTFGTAGTVYYVCTFHPSLMRGRITVR